MFEATLEYAATFKKIIDSMKDLVKNVNIDITSKGMSLQAMDNCHIALVCLQLKENAFKPYKALKPVTIGISIENVAKILKIADGDDSLTLSCEDEPSSLKFHFQSKKGDKISQFNLPLIQIDTDNLGIPQTEYSSICTLPSAQFSRICKEFVGFAECIQIQTNKERIKFGVKGDIGSGSTTLVEQDSGDEHTMVTLDIDEPVNQNFASRYLNLFSKAGGLSSQVTLNMACETPLMVRYSIMNGLGDIKYYLAPKITDDDT